MLLWVAGVHLVIAVGCALALLWDASPLLGVHPATKPLKFALSISLFLGTLAFLVPALSLGSSMRNVVAALLALTMVVEMAAILLQAVRGTTSHFNVGTPFDTAVLRAMMIAIVVATVAVCGLTLVATFAPLRTASGHAMNSLVTTGWRAALWLFLLVPVTGFAMGGRGSHSVGGPDGGPGLPGVNWSLQHGDLRVPHFVAMHALQALPLIATLLVALPISAAARWHLLVIAIALHVGVAGVAMVLAATGRPLW